MNGGSVGHCTMLSRYILQSLFLIVEVCLLTEGNCNRGDDYCGDGGGSDSIGSISSGTNITIPLLALL